MITQNDPLARSVQYLKGVGPARAKAFQKMKIYTIGDLLEHLPRRYADYSNFKPIARTTQGEIETISGVVTGVFEQRPRKGLVITRVAISDGHGTAFAIWFNQPYMEKVLPVGTRVIFSGRVDRRFGQIQIDKPEFEVVEEGSDPIHVGRIVPVHPGTGDLNPRAIRSVVKLAVDQFAHLVPEILPESIRHRRNLIPAAQARAGIHFPADEAGLERARRRLVFEELFILQLGLALLKRRFQTDLRGIPHGPDGDLSKRFESSLPFRMTGAQRRALAQIKADMESDRPMNRLVQGDVGSGKTVVAMAALVKAVENGYQGALMAPTEILAEQHYLNLRRMLEPLGISVVLVIGSQTRKEREQTLALVASGQARVVVGTHALIQDEVQFQRLSLAITDEQHRFGVRQRARLQGKGESPHVLVMTATPIPRTLALTLYGDLDFSVMDELPPGRKPILTYWVEEGRRRRAYEFVRKQIEEGRQAYVVCPLVEESEKLEAEAATQWAEKLRKEFPGLAIGLLHGRMKTEEKDQVMAGFRSGKTQLLVATTVIEVGVDVPNATIMVIEGAERFGLAQLHQLRGRVGRGAHQSYCILVSSPRTDEGRERMQIMQRTSDGFVIAEEDLRLRGPGEFFGTRQHGLPDLKVANPLRDMAILEEAREEALALVERDPGLKDPEHLGLRSALSKKFGAGSGLILVS